MNRSYSTVVFSVITGALLGFICSQFKVSPIYTLSLWAVAALSVGALSHSARQASLNGFVYGFVLSFVFMAVGYNGSEPLPTRFLPFAALGVFGGVCALVWALIGRGALVLVTKRKKEISSRESS